jgi:hypothetical protein
LRRFGLQRCALGFDKPVGPLRELSPLFGKPEPFLPRRRNFGLLPAYVGKPSELFCFLAGHLAFLICAKLCATICHRQPLDPRPQQSRIAANSRRVSESTHEAPDDLADALAFALRFDGRKRKHDAGEFVGGGIGDDETGIETTEG